MSDHPIRPSSLAGIKRFAQSLRRKGLPQGKALDTAARAAQFSNFTHARRVLPAEPPASSRRRQETVWITAYWRDPATLQSGRETLKVVLGSKWADLIGARKFVQLRYLGEFKGQAADHLVCKTLQDKAQRSRDLVCGAARELQFMGATELRPSRKYKAAYPQTDHRDRLPKEDHSSVWADRAGQVHVIVDQPYDTALMHDNGARAAWAARHGYQITQPAWPGMYYPEGGSLLFLVGSIRDAAAHAQWTRALGRLPAPPSSIDWKGESGSFRPLFLSPTEEAQGARPKAPRDLRAARASPLTRPYVQTLVGPRRRPNARMPIESHEEVGRLLTGVLVGASERAGVNSRVNFVLGELDEWVMREFGRAELDDERFFRIYTHGFRKTYASSISDTAKAKHLAALERASELLRSYYPMAAPLRQVLAKLSGAKKSLALWHPRKRRSGPRSAGVSPAGGASATR